MYKLFIKLFSILLMPILVLMSIRLASGKSATFDFNESLNYFNNVKFSTKFEDNWQITNEIFTHISNNEVINGKENVYKEVDVMNPNTLIWYKDKVLVGQSYKWVNANDLNWFDNVFNGANTFFVTASRCLMCLGYYIVDFTSNLGLVLGYISYIISI